LLHRSPLLPSLPPALELLRGLLDEYEEQAATLPPPLSLSRGQREVLREGRRLVVCRDERVDKFMVALLAAPGVRLDRKEGGGEEVRKERVRTVRWYLKLVENGQFVRD